MGRGHVAAMTPRWLCSGGAARSQTLRSRSSPDKCAAPGQVVLRRCISRVVVQVVPWSVDSWAVSFHWSPMMLAR